MINDIVVLRNNLDKLDSIVEYLELEFVDDPLWEEPSNFSWVLRRNRRNFRYPSFKPATNVSRSISSLLFWKV